MAIGREAPLCRQWGQIDWQAQADRSGRETDSQTARETDRQTGQAERLTDRQGAFTGRQNWQRD